MASAKRATFNEKHHLAYLSRGLRLTLITYTYAYTLLSYLRIRYLILCLFYSNAFYIPTFFFNQLLLASGVGCLDS